MRRRTIFLIATMMAISLTLGISPTWAAEQPRPALPATASVQAAPLATISASGYVTVFNIGGGSIAGAKISVLELPQLSTVSDSGGYFQIDGIPCGQEFTLVCEHPDYPPGQSGTFVAGSENIERITFQIPSVDIYRLFSVMTRTVPRPDRCQLISTVTRAGTDVYSPGNHGEAGAIVAAEPFLNRSYGPIYFNVVSQDNIPWLVFPQPSLRQTSEDGGVVYTNVPPGEYILSASKSGVTFRPIKLKCRPGVMVNAAPPWGIQAL
jgi:hypothetical protein